ncbi:FHIPEP family type III secretion protein [Yoonia sp. SS1-5]|uniref:FHIPEP family type III secretion protein n=1 Tax=Yoonia rhodophyticola TaxID=3137370 RepID=A0AAN0MDM9_9RHOB
MNISLAILLLMVAIYIKHPSDFSTFPSVILIGTAFRLALSVGTTRLILADADGGKIIETFGDFVVSGSVVIGLVIFLIITVVQFLVVTKGAERVAEVGARFALDALPGKQMSIDADVRAGNLDPDDAIVKRKQLDRDSQFFGAMDGAMKFVKGDAIAGLIITVINLVGGIAIGVGVHGLDFGDAAATYSLLTIGDGLVAQIPALIMSLVAGMIVTRAVNAENVDLGSDIFRELVADVRVPAMAAGVIFAVGLIPGFPVVAFTGSAILMIVAALGLRRHLRQQEEDAAREEELAAEETDGPAAFSKRMQCRIGTSVAGQVDIDLVNTEIAGMFDQLNSVRGISFLPPQIISDDDAAPDSFVIELDEVPVRQLTVPADSLLVVGEDEVIGLINATPQDIVSVDMLSGPNLWIPSFYGPRLKALNLEIRRKELALAEFVFRIYEQNLGLLFGKPEFETILAELTEVDETTSGEVEESVTRQGLFQVFRYLIEDGVPLRPVALVVDSLSHWSQVNEGAAPEMLAELMRGSMKRQLCRMIAGKGNLLGLAMIDPDLEKLARQELSDLKRSGAMAGVDGLVFDPDITDVLIGKFERLNQAQKHSDGQLAIVVSSDLRRRLQHFLAANRIHIPVLAPHELSPDVTTFPIELLSLDEVESQIDPRVLGRREEAKLFDETNAPVH